MNTTDDSPLVGNRIVVTGMAGAGKSTFSKLLAAQTGLPLIHLDLHIWKPAGSACRKTNFSKSNAPCSPRISG